jgi:hypothetical protein
MTGAKRRRPGPYEASPARVGPRDLAIEDVRAAEALLSSGLRLLLRSLQGFGDVNASPAEIVLSPRTNNKR